MKYIITCKMPDGRKIERICFSELQASIVIGRLHAEGCTEFGMREVTRRF